MVERRKKTIFEKEDFEVLTQRWEYTKSDLSSDFLADGDKKSGLPRRYTPGILVASCLSVV